MKQWSFLKLSVDQKLEFRIYCLEKTSMHQFSAETSHTIMCKTILRPLVATEDGNANKFYV
jgi:hypothetical protein